MKWLLRPGITKYSFVVVIAVIALSQSQSQVAGKTAAAYRKLPLTKFYEKPDPLPPGKPGDLIRSAEFHQYYLPIDVNAVRILYHSRSANGDDVAVSGAVLFPEGKAPAGGWPIIAWAHSWNGVGRECAPSLTKNLQHGPFLAMYVSLGYAVVASDYAGLGANSRSAFADAPSNAADVIYSVPAARTAVPQLANRWLAMGTGEGSRAAIAVGESESEIRNPNYLGSIATSGLANLRDTYQESRSDQAVLFLAYGVKTVFPQFEPKDILTDTGFSLYQQIEHACGSEDQAVRKSMSVLLKPNWRENKFVKSYFERNQLGLKRAAAPLLVVASGSDPLIKQTTQVVDRLCRAGDRVQFENYPESEPGRVIGDSARDQIAWIRSRFANRPAQSNCSQAK